MFRLVLGQIALNRRGPFRVSQAVVAGGLLGRADVGEPLEIGARRIVQPHGSFPGPQFPDRRRQMHHRIVHARDGPVPRSTVNYQTNPVRHLLGGGDLHRRDAPIFKAGSAAFVEREFGIDLAKVLIHHEIDAQAGGFFARFGQENHVAVELDAAALEQQHHFEHGGDL